MEILIGLIILFTFVIGVVIGIKVSKGKADLDSYGRQEWTFDDDE